MSNIMRFASDLEARVQELSDRFENEAGARAHRIVGAALAGPSLAVLGIARYLTPSVNGFGTHMQLGLGGCTMLTLTGWPCPMCGMTTTFSHLAHFQVVQAFWTQPFGLVLFSATVFAALVGTADLLTGAGYWKRTLTAMRRHDQAGPGLLLVGLIGGWLYKCVKMHPEILAWLS